MKTILTAILENISTRSDGSLKLVLGSQEVESIEAGRIFELRNKFLKVMLTDANISPLDEQLLDDLKLKDGKKVKTPSQRLRAVLFRTHEQSGEQIGFDTWYENKMSELIEHFKKKLE